MATKLSGGCICGAVRYECTADPVMSVNCYCRDCQQATGSALAPVIIVPKPALHLRKGEPKYYTVMAESGNEVSRGFCTNCGAPMFSLLSAMPDMIAIKASSLDDPSIFKPTMNVFLSSAQPWAPISKDLPGFAKMPG
jgi:hypothetical protein